MAGQTGDDKNIWNERGELVPLNPPPPVQHSADIAVIIVSRNRPDLVSSLVGQIKDMGRGLSKDIYVVEMGTDEDKLSEHCSFRYEDGDFRGKCYGHNVGLRFARARGDYRYYWILMNDLVFEQGVDALGKMIEICESNPKIAILSPAEPEGPYPDCKPRETGDFHLVSTCDYLALLMRAEAINEVGFLNPDFRYSWGAIHELAYKLYSKGWHVAYCDRVTKKHLGGTTYGKVKGAVSRDEYQQSAKEFAAHYFVEHYGSRWDDEFSKVLPPEIKFNTFKMHRSLWESVLKNDSQEEMPTGTGVLGKTTNLGKQLLSRAACAVPSLRLRRQIEALHPWYYEVEIGRIKVTPGIGSKQTPDQLRGRTAYRTKLLVGEVSKRYDFSGKRLLDIASNCGYWSARYAELGATSLLAVEGRIDYVKQGRLYWESNKFMEPGSFKFLHGNVMSEDTWKAIRERSPFDFALCCGILYHIPEYERLLSNIASVTNGAILVDTRVSDGEEFIKEPGGWCFDSIVETREKKVPNLERLLDLIEELGFEGERLSIKDPTPEGLKGPFDDYNENKRIALLATKKGGHGSAVSS